MRCRLVAELATSHGGDVALAGDMIRAAADAGADLVKIQSYSLAKLNPADPQAEWLKQSHLRPVDHEQLLDVARHVGIELFSTPFDADSLAMLRGFGLKRFKIASSESASPWWITDGCEYWIVSYPWGRRLRDMGHLRLTAIPLYPTPLEAVESAQMLDGWSDHCEGIIACQRAMVYGATMIEAHFCLPGRSRQKSWDKTPEQFRQLRAFSEEMATIQTGVSQVFRDRWSQSA